MNMDTLKKFMEMEESHMPAHMALSHNIGVPWIICRQYDAPNPVV